MALIDISNWPSGNQRFVPIGKRIKKVVLHPETFELYYFKEPKEKYPWEFWNEIIAHEVGVKLGFNVLKYEPAILEGIGGCLSKSMTEDFTQELIHGQQVLLRIYPEFETKKGTDHTFQLVESFFKSLNDEEERKSILKEFIEMLVFDAVIGNRDRHQQNWAIIREIKVKMRTKNFFGFKKQPDLPVITRVVRFSPLFDNGNCLAYNIIEEKLDAFINDENKLYKYLFGEKAVSHLKWYGTPMPHIELLKHISNIYPEEVLKSASKVNESFNENIIKDIIFNIDNGVIFAEEKYILSPKRKELISKLIIVRTKRLLEALL